MFLLKTDAMDSVLERGAAAVIAAAEAMPKQDGLAKEMAFVLAAEGRGYFLPDEEEMIRFVFSRYLGLRAALMETLGDLGDAAGRWQIEWRDRLPFFATAFAAACVLMRADRFVVDAATRMPVLWKKLDEEDPRSGVPRKTFTRIFKAASLPANSLRFLMAAEFYRRNRAEILALKPHPVVGQVVNLLLAEESHIENRQREAVKLFFGYRWFSFLRRHRSAWKKVMFGFFEASGRAVSELRQPGIKPSGAPKRITPMLRAAVLEQAGPGDVFVTRHDDALSNLFLPGFWPHAALYLGTTADLQQMNIDLPSGQTGQAWFLESKKDGVRIRLAEETLEVDACVILKSPLTGAELTEALRRAMSHTGKPYDFLFDFRTADRMVCTEVIYRGFHGIGPVHFHLKEVGGRLCLPAGELLDQALGCGYEITATCGLQGDVVKLGAEAKAALALAK